MEHSNTSQEAKSRSCS